MDSTTIPDMDETVCYGSDEEENDSDITCVESTNEEIDSIVNNPLQHAIVQQGPSQQGPSQEGPTHQVPTNQRPTQQGPTHHGPTQQGPTHHGPTQQGPSQHGRNHECASQHGPTQQGPKEKPCKIKNNFVEIFKLDSDTNSDADPYFFADSESD